MRLRRLHKRMYAVSQLGLGLIAGTMAYSRRDAIMHFQGGGFIPQEWERAKHEGYRTVAARVAIVPRTVRK